MSLEAWGDGDDGFDPEPLLNAGWWDPDKAASAEKIIRMIAEMPASTHEIDAALCREWLADNGDGK